MPAHNVATRLRIRTSQCFEHVKQQFRTATSGFVCNRPFYFSRKKFGSSVHIWYFYKGKQKHDPLSRYNNACYGKLLPRISVHFSESFLLKKFVPSELAMLQFAQSQVFLWSFCFVFRFFLSLLADFPFK